MTRLALAAGCAPDFSPEEITALIHWTIERVDHLYAYLFELNAHVDSRTVTLVRFSWKKDI